MRQLWFVLRLGAALVLFGVAAGLTAIVVAPQAAVVATSGSWTSGGEIDLRENPTRSLVYDLNGNLMARWYKDNREPIELDAIPSKVRDAVLAIEDSDFYEHKGINIRSYTRATLSNLDAGGITQGGSTITQQLIKNLVLDDDQSIERKFQEAALAIRLEKELSKEEILETYLNTVYLGSGAYGVRAAAEVYFGAVTIDLEGDALAAELEDKIDWPEAALLASMISNPSAYDPFIYPETALRQRRIALDRLAEEGLITEEEVLEYNRVPLPQEAKSVAVPPEDYFVAEVRKQILEDPKFLGGSVAYREEQINEGGLRVYTTFDQRAQALAEQARDTVMRQRYNIPLPFTTAIAAVDPNTGAVRAMLAGEDFRDDQFNLVTQGARQPGSSMKPFVLAAMFSNGYGPQDKINGRGPCEFAGLGDNGQPYKVRNFGNSPGSIDTIEGLTLASSNCGFVKMGQLVGVDRVREVAKDLGVASPLLEIPSLPLGTEGITPLEMASAYAGFVNDGIRVVPYLIERIEDSEGNVIYSAGSDPTRAPVQVIDPQVACTVSSVLQANGRSGTGSRAQGYLSAQPIAGKTGTTEESNDAWFVGFTPYLSTAVWIGNPEGLVQLNFPSTGLITGSSVPNDIWGEFNRLYREAYNIPVTPFPNCQQVVGEGKLIITDFDDDLPLSPCPGAWPADTNLDGAWDTCVPPGAAGYTVCSGNVFFDEDGDGVPIYCAPPPEPEPDDEGEDEGEDGGADDGGADDGGDGGGGDGGGADDGGGGGGGGGGGDAADGGGGDG